MGQVQFHIVQMNAQCSPPVVAKETIRERDDPRIPCLCMPGVARQYQCRIGIEDGGSEWRGGPGSHPRPAAAGGPLLCLHWVSSVPSFRSILGQPCLFALKWCNMEAIEEIRRKISRLACNPRDGTLPKNLCSKGMACFLLRFCNSIMENGAWPRLPPQFSPHACRG